MMSEVKYWVGFNMIPGIGRVRLSQIQQHFDDLENAWHASLAALRDTGLDTRSVQAIVTYRSTIDLDDEMDKLERLGVNALILNDSSYPPRLKEIYDPPPVLYVSGELMPDDEWSLAVVGTRRATIYGREATQRLVTDLARNRVTVVSGLARGIDTVAHKAALTAKGRTIAVCACGLDIVYPPENRNLAQEIAKNGALVSEYHLGTKPRADNFPRRNRIMSGLSLGTLVIEATERSGALITARIALEQDRDVFAVPGSILSASSRGSNLLIRDGAKAVLDVNDVLEELNLSVVPQQMVLKEVLPGNEAESLLLQYLSEGPIHIDELCRCSSLPVSTVSSTLTMMELKGMVSNLGNMNYAKT